MAKVAGLVGELRQQVKNLEDDLRARVDGAEEYIRQPGVYERWHAEWEAALKAERTAASWQAWRDERVTQAAVGWVLLTVFARFCEDNELVEPLWIAGHTRERRQIALDARREYFQINREENDRHWLSQIVEHFAAMGATAGLVDEFSPLHQVAPSGDAARQLLEFWWETDSEGELLRQFRDPGLDTRFLGDLYQDLSEEAKDKYALLQTPEFVEEFILDQTMEPALAERPLEGFTVIDPTCGSGHFLLGAFARLLGRWSKHAPNLEPRALVQKALDGVHGVDINPFAIAIARFRLIVAALQATGELTLDKPWNIHLNLASGDSLLFGARQQGLKGDLFSIDETVFAYSLENREALERLLQVRDGEPVGYDVVVGNPPYISVKDAAARNSYRILFNYCHGKYTLTVPFMELFFNLAKSGARPGWIGKITSNAFMQREFGKPLIERFLARKDLRAVINSEGAWIPGHNSDGTPTVILLAKNQGRADQQVRVALSKGLRESRGASAHGEGPYWRGIVENLNNPGFDNDWITVTDINRDDLDKHPWSLSGGGAVELLAQIERASTRRLDSVIEGKVGFASFPGADDAFIAPRQALKRDRVPTSLIRPLIAGKCVRNWGVEVGVWAFVPYDTDANLVQLSLDSSWHRRQWPFRATTGGVTSFNGETQASTGKPWWAWYRWVMSRYRTPLSITFAEVATHNHFVLDRGGSVFKQTAPVIKLPNGTTEREHFELLGILNSSIACFWLKEKCKPKGGSADQFWSRTFQFSSTKVQNLPLPIKAPVDHARTLDSLARELTKHTPQAVVRAGVPTSEAFDAAYAKHTQIRSRMIAHQEELDWQCYRMYGLIDDDLVSTGELPGIDPAQRAFAIKLASEIEPGAVELTWFTHPEHQFDPIKRVPTDWPNEYRNLIHRRLDTIRNNKLIRLLERPEYKRRWETETWDEQVRSALADWLLDELENQVHWFDRQGRPRPRSVAQLADEVARDDDFRGTLELWTCHPDIDVASGLQDLLEDQAVPFLAAYRYKPSGLEKRKAWEQTWAQQRKEDTGERPQRPIPVPPKYTNDDFVKASYGKNRGELDVPKERFILYPDAGRETDPTPLLGWAGWDYAQQALALATIMNEREAEGWTDEDMVPLIAGLAELQPWVRQWHADTDPTYGVSLAAIIDEELVSRAQRAGKTLDELAAWRPAAPTRGRRRKTATQGDTA